VSKHLPKAAAPKGADPNLESTKATASTRLADASPDELVAMAKAGNQRAFNQLVIRYRGRIYALGLHLTGRPSDADDITQDAFMRAYAKLDTFQGRSQFFTWLYRIALHRALNIKRARGRRRIVAIDDARVDAAISVDAHNPRHAAEMRQEYAHLLNAFDALSPTLSTTVALTTLQGLSYREAATVLDTTEGTVAWRVHEARRQLRATMSQAAQPPTGDAATARKRKTSGRHRKAVPEIDIDLRQLLTVS